MAALQMSAILAGPSVVVLASTCQPARSRSVTKLHLAKERSAQEITVPRRAFSFLGFSSAITGLHLFSATEDAEATFGRNAEARKKLVEKLEKVKERALSTEADIEALEGTIIEAVEEAKEIGDEEIVESVSEVEAKFEPLLEKERVLIEEVEAALESEVVKVMEEVEELPSLIKGGETSIVEEGEALAEKAEVAIKEAEAEVIGLIKSEEDSVPEGISNVYEALGDFVTDKVRTMME
eukprot:TRINITY_DN6359_c0_g1_i4.p1 TRINITY_DN6359_c0_g1~~TRINITY_DN6359_c0_g1_i4.p1  ORF type:complete len:258 (+),score=58.80 TRINITY_DN6359_c0_g1_i4:62-775(+)